ncbi:MAG: histidine triad nucleotide-binding protein [Myxococcota bacterium]
MSTIFGKIVRGEADADIVYEDDRCVAFRDINPAAPTHVLVIPRKEIVNVADLGEDDESLAGHCLRVCAKVAEQEGLEHYRVVTNNGAGSGQSVFHLHFHVLGGRDFRWPPG